ncbi:MAG: AraC family transcriptional regulator [Saprospiraceae bacterium]|nr:AraC family transcriptional regulator [Saprospiraceae bacterium]
MAMAALPNPDLRATADAFEAGFNDPGYFARVFRQAFGVMPQEWRGKTRGSPYSAATSVSRPPGSFMRICGCCWKWCWMWM